MSEPAIPLGVIDPDAAKVVRRIARHGFRAYLVGGCVRDLLVGRRPKDFDLATGARPRQIKRLFRNSRIIGRRFKLVHVRFGPKTIEVSTFRAPPDQEGDDLYVRRDNVFGTEKQDAFRRDFTINGLFYDVEAERVIDHVGGLEDLEARRIRMIGDPDLRLREDPVRILRAARFAGRLGFELTDDLFEAARAHRHDLQKAAPPRVLEEFYRLLSGDGAADAFRILHSLGALEVLIPEICPPPEEFYRALERLAERTRGHRGGVPQSLLLAVLLSPHVHASLTRDDVPPDYEAAVQELLRPLGERMTLARRDQTVARQCLAAQARFMREPRTRSDHRFASREFIREACALREILGPLEPVEPDPYVRWAELSQAGAHPPGRRKRRRRRRRRRHLSRTAQAGKDGACPPPSASSSAPVPPTPLKE